LHGAEEYFLDRHIGKKKGGRVNQAARTATVAPMRRHRRKLEGEPQTQTDVPADLEQNGLAVLAVERDRTCAG